MSESDISMDSYDSNLQKKAEDVPKCEEKCPRVVCVCRSGGKEFKKEYKNTVYQFKKWTFLMTAKESKDILKKQLEDIKTEITLGITNSYWTVEFFSSHVENFEFWVERCFQLTEKCFRDLELLSVDGELNEIPHLSKQIEKSNKNYSISLFEMKGVGGIFLLGRGEHIIDLISDLQTYFRNTIIQSPERNDSIAYNLFDLSPMQCRLIAVFNGIEQASEKYPSVKVYRSGEKVKMIGNKNDCAAATEYLKNNSWMKDVQYERCTQFNGFEFFLNRVNVQAFIDSRITKYAGTWAVTRRTEPLSSDLIFIYGKTRHDVEGILKILLESIKRKEISITGSACTEENVHRWTAYAEKLGHNFEGKFNLQLSTKKGSDFLDARFIFTSDLVDEESVKMLISDVELQIPRKETIPLKQKHFIWLQKCYLNFLKTEAKKIGIGINFLREKNVIEITGLSSALTEMKQIIHSICMEEQEILLPFAALPSKVTGFLNECQCCFEYSPYEKSRLWIKGNTGVVVYKGEFGTDRFYANFYVKSMESEERDMVIEWLDEETALLKFPLWREGETRKRNQMEEVLQLLFSEVREQKKKYVAFDLQDMTSWPVQAFVKSIIDCVPKPPEGLIIWISHPDEVAFQTAVNCIKEAEFPKTGQRNKSSKIEFQVIKGRITELPEKVDVIVNTTSLSLDMTSGAVSASILKAAGYELKAELAQYPADYKTGQIIRINYGDVAETFAYRLNCQRIFHGALYKWKEDPEKALEILRQFLKKCICLADERKFKTIAFPAIGTGQLKIPAAVVASCVRKIVDEYAASHTKRHVEKILFVIYEKDVKNFKVFQTILEHGQDTTETPEVPVLYRFSVYGEKHNVVGAMNILAGLFREHVQAKYELATSTQEVDQKGTPQQGNVHGKPHEQTDEYAISQPLAAVSSTKENEIASSLEDQLCLLLQSKEKIILTEENLGPVLKDANYETIICPFLEEGCALIKFKLANVADKFFRSFVNEQYVLRKLPIQAVTNIKAKLSSKVISILQRRSVTSQDFKRKTGAYLCTDTWTVEGSLVMVQNGERFIKELVVEENEAPNLSIQRGNQSANSLTSTADNGLLKKHTKRCSIYEEKALRELFTSTELPFSNVNIVEDISGQKVISGTQKNVNPFEKALSELKFQDLSQITLREFQDFEKKKSESVSVSFAKERHTMRIFSRSLELLQRSVEEFRRLQDDSLVLSVEEFNSIVFFEKSLRKNFPETNGKIVVRGPECLVNKFRTAVNKIKKYTVQRISITDLDRKDAEWFIAQFSRENGNVYIQMKENEILVTGKKTAEVLQAKQKIDSQIETMRKRKIGYESASSGVPENSLTSVSMKMHEKAEIPNVVSRLMSPKTADIVFKYSDVTVYAFDASILQVKTDAIVNPVSTDLSQLILREAGSSVQMQCSEIFDSRKDNTLHIGEAFVTDGGSLSHLLKIIHVNVPNWYNYALKNVESPCEKCIDDIAATVKVSLEKGHQNNVKVIAMPPLSACGIGSAPLPVCGRAYVSAVTSYIDAYPRETKNEIREIYFVDTDQSTLHAIKCAFSGLQHWVFHQAENEEHFYVGREKIVKIIPCGILWADAEALVAPQDGEMKNERYIARSLLQCECKTYEKEFAKFHGHAWRVGDIRTTTAPKPLKFNQILHVYSPSWRSDVPLDVKIKDIKTCIKNIFKEASKLNLRSVAIPTFGGGMKDNISKQKIFKEIASAIVECLTETVECTVRVISIMDELNVALMTSEFYKILSQDGKTHNMEIIDVQRPNLQMQETEI